MCALRVLPKLGIASKGKQIQGGVLQPNLLFMFMTFQHVKSMEARSTRRLLPLGQLDLMTLLSSSPSWEQGSRSDPPEYVFLPRPCRTVDNQ